MYTISRVGSPETADGVDRVFAFQLCMFEIHSGLSITDQKFPFLGAPVPSFELRFKVLSQTEKASPPWNHLDILAMRLPILARNQAGDIGSKLADIG